MIEKIKAFLGQLDDEDDLVDTKNKPLSDEDIQQKINRIENRLINKLNRSDEPVKDLATDMLKEIASANIN